MYFAIHVMVLLRSVLETYTCIPPTTQVSLSTHCTCSTSPPYGVASQKGCSLMPSCTFTPARQVGLLQYIQFTKASNRLVAGQLSFSGGESQGKKRDNPIANRIRQLAELEAMGFIVYTRDKWSCMHTGIQA